MVVEYLVDLVSYILALCPQNKVQIPKDRMYWHMAFYKFKQDLPQIKEHAPPIVAKAIPKFLEEMWFDWDGPYPKSKDLDEILSGTFGLNALQSLVSISHCMTEEFTKSWMDKYLALEPADRMLVYDILCRMRKSFPQETLWKISLGGQGVASTD